MKASPADEPPRPQPAKVVAAEPELRPDAEPRSASRPAAPAPRKTAAGTRRSSHHVEPEKKVVDPIEGFDTGEAFDNPASPGRYGQRTSGLLERAPAPARPNVPDPSFGRTPQ